MLGTFTIGDAIYQFFTIAFFVLIIVVIVSFIRSNRGRKNQLNRIEKKIDDLITKNNE